jgi:hypothetical protein
MSGLKRPITVLLRLNDNELADLNKIVEQSGFRSRESYLRQMALHGQIIRLDVSEIQETLRLLGTIARNVNQLTKRAHESRSIYETDIIALREQIQAAIMQAREVLKVYQKAKTLFGGTV